MPSQPHTGSSSTAGQPSGITVHTPSSYWAVPQLLTGKSQYSPALHDAHAGMPVSVSVSPVSSVVVVTSPTVGSVVLDVPTLVDALVVVALVETDVDTVLLVPAVVSLPPTSSSLVSSAAGQPNRRRIATQCNLAMHGA